jgi:hypothetical protein
MGWNDRRDESDLIGLTVKFIDVGPDSIMITTECDRKFMFYHDQDCCESVGIYDSKGDLKSLVGKRLEYVGREVCDIPEDVTYEERDDSYTWTNLIFRTTNETVISRWIGESNGYYSENVDLEEITEST